MFEKEVQAIYLTCCASNRTVAFPYFAERARKDKSSSGNGIYSPNTKF